MSDGRTGTSLPVRSATLRERGAEPAEQASTATSVSSASALAALAGVVPPEQAPQQTESGDDRSAVARDGGES